MKKIIILIILIIFGSILYYIFDNGLVGSVAYDKDSQDQNQEPFLMPEMGDRYVNDEYGLSFAVPEGFSVREFSDNLSGIDYLVIENNKGDGVQISVTPFDDVTIIDEALIRSQIPDMKISDVQVLEIGESYRGAAFISDNAAFGGSSREVWFVFRSNLYQISTYARLDELLKSVFSTWQFE